MTDYRDPNYRNPSYRDPLRPSDPTLSPDGQPWSNATWGWIAGIAVVVLVLIFAFGRGDDQLATETAVPPVTTGQRTMPLPPPSGPKSDAPAMNRPAPSAPEMQPKE